MKQRTLFVMMGFNLILLMQLAIASCGKANSANSSYAELIQSNMTGVQCFLIRDENGKAVGGSCVRE